MAMTRNLQNQQVESLQAAMRARQIQLREEIRQALIKSDSEHYLQIADSVRELEDESFADLIVDVGLAEIDRDLDELRAIDAALLRVADGSYGICAACDKPIGVKRLNLTPQALRCIDCQRLFERTHFQKTGHTL
jgi:RNA polymerase-binding protein DksA